MDIVKVFRGGAEADWNISIGGTEDDPLFLAKDVAEILGITNIRMTLNGPDFPSEYKAVRRTDTPGGVQQTTFLTELGLYEMLARSRKPIAVQFRGWVHTVIRDIRISGRYELERAARTAEEQKVALQTENGLLQDRLAVKVNFLYVYKCDRRESDDYCTVKVGSAKQVDKRQAPYLQVTPDGYMLLAVEVPTDDLKRAEDIAHMLLETTHKCVRRESYRMPVEVAKSVIRLVPDLIHILRADNREALDHLVQCTNHDMRGEGQLPAQSADELPVELGAMGMIQESLDDIRSQLRGLRQPVCGGTDLEVPEDVDTADDTAEVQTLPVQRTARPSGDPEIRRAWQFDLFIEECCELDPEARESSVTVSGRHRVWAKLASHKLRYALVDYMKTRFKPIRHEAGGGNRHGFQGVRVLPVRRPGTLLASMPEGFLQARCVDAPQSRIFDYDLRSEFFGWRREAQADYEEDSAELAEVHKYLSDCYFRAPAIWRPEKKSSEPGYYGVCLPGDVDKYLRQMPTVLSRPVVMVDNATGAVKRSFDQVSKAAAALGLSTSSVGYYIQKKKLRDGCLIKYGNKSQAQAMDEEIEENEEDDIPGGQ